VRTRVCHPFVCRRRRQRLQHDWSRAAGPLLRANRVARADECDRHEVHTLDKGCDAKKLTQEWHLALCVRLSPLSMYRYRYTHTDSAYIHKWMAMITRGKKYTHRSAGQFTPQEADVSTEKYHRLSARHPPAFVLYS